MRIVNSLKSNKAPGENVAAAKIRRNEISKIYAQTNAGHLGERRNTGRMGNCNYTPLPKNGDKIMCEHCRRIALLNIGYKILRTAISEIYIPSNGSADYHNGFRKRRSTMEHIFCIKRY